MVRNRDGLFAISITHESYPHIPTRVRSMDACSDESVMNNAGYILVVYGEGWLRIFVLDRIGLYVHVVNGFPIFPYNSWIYKGNETFYS